MRSFDESHGNTSSTIRITDRKPPISMSRKKLSRTVSDGIENEIKWRGTREKMYRERESSSDRTESSFSRDSLNKVHNYVTESSKCFADRNRHERESSIDRISNIMGRSVRERSLDRFENSLDRIESVLEEFGRAGSLVRSRSASRPRSYTGKLQDFRNSLSDERSLRNFDRNIDHISRLSSVSTDTPNKRTSVPTNVESELPRDTSEELKDFIRLADKTQALIDRLSQKHLLATSSTTKNQPTDKENNIIDSALNDLDRIATNSTISDWSSQSDSSKFSSVYLNNNNSKPYSYMNSPISSSNSKNSSFDFTPSLHFESPSTSSKFKTEADDKFRRISDKVQSILTDDNSSCKKIIKSSFDKTAFSSSKFNENVLNFPFADDSNKSMNTFSGPSKLNSNLRSEIVKTDETDELKVEHKKSVKIKKKKIDDATTSINNESKTEFKNNGKIGDASSSINIESKSDLKKIEKISDATSSINNESKSKLKKIVRKVDSAASSSINESKTELKKIVEKIDSSSSIIESKTKSSLFSSLSIDSKHDDIIHSENVQKLNERINKLTNELSLIDDLVKDKSIDYLQLSLKADDTSVDTRAIDSQSKESKSVSNYSNTMNSDGMDKKTTVEKIPPIMDENFGSKTSEIITNVQKVEEKSTSSIITETKLKSDTKPILKSQINVEPISNIPSVDNIQNKPSSSKNNDNSCDTSSKSVSLKVAKEDSKSDTSSISSHLSKLSSEDSKSLITSKSSTINPTCNDSVDKASSSLDNNSISVNKSCSSVDSNISNNDKHECADKLKTYNEIKSSVSSTDIKESSIIGIQGIDKTLNDSKVDSADLISTENKVKTVKVKKIKKSSSDDNKDSTVKVVKKKTVKSTSGECSTSDVVRKKSIKVKKSVKETEDKLNLNKEETVKNINMISSESIINQSDKILSNEKIFLDNQNLSGEKLLSDKIDINKGVNQISNKDISSKIDSNSKDSLNHSSATLKQVSETSLEQSNISIKDPILSTKDEKLSKAENNLNEDNTENSDRNNQTVKVFDKISETMTVSETGDITVVCNLKKRNSLNRKSDSSKKFEYFRSFSSPAESTSSKFDNCTNSTKENLNSTDDKITQNTVVFQETSIKKQLKTSTNVLKLSNENSFDNINFKSDNKKDNFEAKCSSNLPPPIPAKFDSSTKLTKIGSSSTSIKSSKIKDEKKVNEIKSTSENDSGTTVIKSQTCSDSKLSINKSENSISDLKILRKSSIQNVNKTSKLIKDTNSNSEIEKFSTKYESESDVTLQTVEKSNLAEKVIPSSDNVSIKNNNLDDSVLNEKLKDIEAGTDDKNIDSSKNMKSSDDVQVNSNLSEVDKALISESSKSLSADEISDKHNDKDLENTPLTSRISPKKNIESNLKKWSPNKFDKHEISPIKSITGLNRKLSPKMTDDKKIESGITEKSYIPRREISPLKSFNKRLSPNINENRDISPTKPVSIIRRVSPKIVTNRISDTILRRYSPKTSDSIDYGEQSPKISDNPNDKDVKRRPSPKSAVDSIRRKWSPKSLNDSNKNIGNEFDKSIPRKLSPIQSKFVKETSPKKLVPKFVKEISPFKPINNESSPKISHSKPDSESTPETVDSKSNNDETSKINDKLDFPSKMDGADSQVVSDSSKSTIKRRISLKTNDKSDLSSEVDCKDNEISSDKEVTKRISPKMNDKTDLSSKIDIKDNEMSSDKGVIKSRISPTKRNDKSDLSSKSDSKGNEISSDKGVIKRRISPKTNDISDLTSKNDGKDNEISSDKGVIEKRISPTKRNDKSDLSSMVDDKDNDTSSDSSKNVIKRKMSPKLLPTTTKNESILRKPISFRMNLSKFGVNQDNIVSSRRSIKEKDFSSNSFGTKSSNCDDVAEVKNCDRVEGSVSTESKQSTKENQNGENLNLPKTSDELDKTVEKKIIKKTKLVRKIKSDTTKSALEKMNGKDSVKIEPKNLKDENVKQEIIKDDLNCKQNSNIIVDDNLIDDKLSKLNNNSLSSDKVSSNLDENSSSQFEKDLVNKNSSKTELKSNIENLKLNSINKISKFDTLNGNFKIDESNKTESKLIESMTKLDRPECSNSIKDSLNMHSDISDQTNLDKSILNSDACSSNSSKLKSDKLVKNNKKTSKKIEIESSNDSDSIPGEKSVLEKFLDLKPSKESRIEKAIKSLRRNSFGQTEIFTESKLLKRATSMEDFNSSSELQNFAYNSDEEIANIKKKRKGVKIRKGSVYDAIQSRILNGNNSKLEKLLKNNTNVDDNTNNNKIEQNTDKQESDEIMDKSDDNFSISNDNNSECSSDVTENSNEVEDRIKRKSYYSRFNPSCSKIKSSSIKRYF